MISLLIALAAFVFRMFFGRAYSAVMMWIYVHKVKTFFASDTISCIGTA